MLQFSIGLSALQAAQQGLAIAGNNLTNASTPGYHRQTAQLTNQDPMHLGDLSFGRGVAITDIHRAVNDQLDSSLTRQLTQNGFVDARLGSSSQVEQSLATGTSSPEGQLESLLSKLQQLSSNPTDGASRQATIASVASVARAFNAVSADLFQIQRGLDQAIRGVIDQINPLSKQIATLNGEIGRLTNQGVSPNDLLDQRGQLVNNLAQLVGVQVQNGDNGQVTVMAAGVPLVIGDQSTPLVAGTDKSGAATIGVTGSDAVLSATEGQLGGLLSQRNDQLIQFRHRIDTLARQVASSFDAIQSTGLGGAGGFSQLDGQRGVNDVTANLNAAGLAFPPKAGSLFVGVTNTATGQRTVTEIPINPQTQTIKDVASSIGSTVPNVQAFVNSQTGTLSLTAAPGYKFDFTGGFGASPTTSFTPVNPPTATIGGIYSGATNDKFTFAFTPLGGTVGVTPGLQVQITNAQGSIATVNVGQGYKPGQPLNVGNGLTLTLGTGDVAAADSFTSTVIGNPDSAGLLTSFGLNTLFSGNDAGTLKVNADLVADSSRLATSRAGQPGDISNLKRFVALGDAAVLGNGTQTFSQYSNQILSDIGSDVQSLTQQQSTNQLLTSGIQKQQQSVSGVDTNEELANVLKYQRMFQMAGKYISAVNDALQQLISITN